MYEKIPLAGVDTEGWLRLRKSGIGGSDAGAVCGVNPYSSAMKVFQDKTSESVEEQDNEAIRIGHDLEDYVAQRFTEATGLKVRKSNFIASAVSFCSGMASGVSVAAGVFSSGVFFCSAAAFAASLAAAFSALVIFALASGNTSGSTPGA